MRQASLRSSDSRTSLQDKVPVNNSFLEKEIKNITIDDRKELQLEKRQKEAKLAMTEKKVTGKRLSSVSPRVPKSRRSSIGSTMEKTKQTRNAIMSDINEIVNLRGMHNHTVQETDMKPADSGLFVHTQLEENPTLATSKMLTISHENEHAASNADLEKTVKDSEDLTAPMNPGSLG